MTRRSRLAVMMMSPAIVTAIAVSTVETWRLLRPRSEFFAAPFVYSLAEAIERHDLDQAYGFIRAGQDPNQPIAVVRGGQSVLMPPLLWAITTRNRDAVLMLVGFGARVDRAAVCLAEEMGSADVARLLESHGPGAVTCPPPRPTAESVDAAALRRAPPSAPALPARPPR